MTYAVAHVITDRIHACLILTTRNLLACTALQHHSTSVTAAFAMAITACQLLLVALSACAGVDILWFVLAAGGC